MNLRILGGLFLLCASAAIAQPVITDGVLNSASYTPVGLPNSGIAQGSLFVVKGKGLGPASIVQANSFPLPKTLGNTSIKVNVGGQSIDAIMIYTLSRQVAAILPSSTPLGDGTLTVTYNGQTSATTPIKVVKSSFGMYALNQNGSGPGVYTDPNFQVITLINSAKPGDLIFIWGTGLGPVTEDETTKAPTPGDLPVDVKVYVGGKEAAVSYKGRSGCCVALDQILFTVPQGVEGCYVPVAVSVGGVVSNFTTIPVSSAANRICSDPSGFTAAQMSQLASGGSLKIGQINLQRVASDVSAFGLTISVKEDRGTASFYNFDQRALLTTRGLSDISNYGSCKVFACSSIVCIPDRFPEPVNTLDDPVKDADVPAAPTLDAGTSLTIAGPKGSKDMTRSSDFGYYAGTLFDRTESLSSSEGYFTPGNYTITGKGGKDVGAFTANTTMAASAVTWTNKAAVPALVDRATPLNITWSGGGANDYVAVFGNSIDAANTSATFVCTEKASAGQLTVPTWVLSALPASAQQTVSGIGIPGGFLLIGAIAAPTTFSAPGIDLGLLNRQIVEGKNLTYR